MQPRFKYTKLLLCIMFQGRYKCYSCKETHDTLKPLAAYPSDKLVLFQQNVG